MKNRQSNFELMRLISMFFIVIFHVIVHGKILDSSNEILHLISSIITTIIIIHVNSLVFLTGYFNIDKKEISLKKAGKLLATTWFYKASIILLFLYFHFVSIDKVTLLEELLPLDRNHYWFISCYIVIYILSPYLNKVVENLSEKDFSKFLLWLMILLSIIPTITNNHNWPNDGQNIINFALLYYLGAYFKRYPIQNNYHFKHVSKRKILYFLIGSFFGIVMIRLSLYYFGLKLFSMENHGLKWVGEIMINDFSRYSSPLVIIQSCLYCLVFANLKFHSKIINFSAASTFGIYLIHDNHNVRYKIYEWLNVHPYPTLLETVKVLFLSSLTIFSICFIIETIRRMIVLFLSYMYNKSKMRKS